jgi:hypothetical protein
MRKCGKIRIALLKNGKKNGKIDRSLFRIRIALPALICTSKCLFLSQLLSSWPGKLTIIAKLYWHDLYTLRVTIPWANPRWIDLSRFTALDTLVFSKFENVLVNTHAQRCKTGHCFSFKPEGTVHFPSPGSCQHGKATKITPELLIFRNHVWWSANFTEMVS